MSILGVTIVLFLLGIVGWLSINSQKLMQHFRESVEVQVFLKPSLDDTAHLALQEYIASKPYTKKITYTDKEAAKTKWLQSGGEDFSEFFDFQVLPTSIDFTIKNEFMDSARLADIQTDISKFEIVDEVKYPKGVVSRMQRNFNYLQLGVGILAVIMAILVIILIDNTIRLAMFSNRFLIKTMQMVGATRGFIARPLDMKALGNGLLSGLIAIGLLYACVVLSEKYIPGMRGLRDNSMMLLLFMGMIIVGMSITLLSTHRSVIKYLRMKLDELY